jgi:hypothetical protein
VAINGADDEPRGNTQNIIRTINNCRADNDQIKIRNFTELFLNLCLIFGNNSPRFEF